MEKAKKVGGSVYSRKSSIIKLNKDISNKKAAGILSHEIMHKIIHKDKTNTYSVAKSNIKSQTKDEYVTSSLKEEAFSEMFRAQVYQEFPKDKRKEIQHPGYFKSIDGVKGSKIFEAAYKRLSSDTSKTMSSNSTSKASNHKEYYGNQWEKANKPRNFFFGQSIK